MDNNSSSQLFMVNSPRLFHPPVAPVMEAVGGLLKASSDYLQTNEFMGGDLSLANDSILDLFPGLVGKKSVSQSSMEHRTRNTQQRFSKEPQNNEKQQQLQQQKQKKQQNVENEKHFLRISDSTFGSPFIGAPSLPTNNSSSFVLPQVPQKETGLLNFEQSRRTIPPPIVTIAPSSTSLGYSSDVSKLEVFQTMQRTADAMAVRLAQQALELSFLPKRVKLIRDLSDDVISSIQNDSLVNIQDLIQLQHPHEQPVSDAEEEFRHAQILAGSIIAGQSTPIKFIVMSALTAPVPRSAGTPTNVSVPSDIEMDSRTLKRLRNRISASRCRLRKRIWTLGLEKCERELSTLTTELEDYIDTLENEREALMRVLTIANSTD